MTTELEIDKKAQEGDYLKVADPKDTPHYFKIIEKQWDELKLERERDGEIIETLTKDLKKALDRIVVAEDYLELLYMAEGERCNCCQ